MFFKQYDGKTDRLSTCKNFNLIFLMFEIEISKRQIIFDY